MANVNSRSVKRILAEARELVQWPSAHFSASPLEDNLFEWHFTLRGAEGTPFQGGLYHGRIVLPAEYPFKPPSIYLLTPNGRFETGKKICLSISAHHPESWQPAWGVRTILTALIAFFPTKAEGALAGLDYSDDERRVLAARSLAWRCPKCNCTMAEALPPNASQEGESARAMELRTEAAEAAKQLQLVAHSEGSVKEDSAGASSVATPHTANPGAPAPKRAPHGTSAAEEGSASQPEDAAPACSCSPHDLARPANSHSDVTSASASAPAVHCSLTASDANRAEGWNGADAPGPLQNSSLTAPLRAPAAVPPSDSAVRNAPRGSTFHQHRTEQVPTHAPQHDWLGMLALALMVAIVALIVRKFGIFASCNDESSWTESCSLGGGSG